MFAASEIFPNGLKAQFGDEGMGFGQAFGGVAGRIGKVERSCSDGGYIRMNDGRCSSI